MAGKGVAGIVLIPSARRKKLSVTSESDFFQACRDWIFVMLTLKSLIHNVLDLVLLESFDIYSACYTLLYVVNLMVYCIFSMYHCLYHQVLFPVQP